MTHETRWANKRDSLSDAVVSHHKGQRQPIG